MTVMVSTVVFGLESPSGDACHGRGLGPRADQEAVPGCRVADIRGGVLRGTTVDLFKVYVDNHPAGDPLTV